eukprot:scaffold90252_cov20-Tisochrysis_lutea.AAC.1
MEDNVCPHLWPSRLTHLHTRCVNHTDKPRSNAWLLCSFKSPHLTASLKSITFTSSTADTSNGSLNCTTANDLMPVHLTCVYPGPSCCCPGGLSGLLCHLLQVRMAGPYHSFQPAAAALAVAPAAAAAAAAALAAVLVHAQPCSSHP